MLDTAKCVCGLCGQTDWAYTMSEPGFLTPEDIEREGLISPPENIGGDLREYCRWAGNHGKIMLHNHAKQFEGIPTIPSCYDKVYARCKRFRNFKPKQGKPTRFFFSSTSPRQLTEEEMAQLRAVIQALALKTFGVQLD